MNALDAFPSNYLQSSEFKGKPTRLTISTVSQEEIGQDRKKKLVIYFKNRDQAMVVNKTNAMTLISAFGPETAGWVGKPVEVYTEPTLFQGKRVDGLRVRPTLAAVLNDDIPELA